MKVSIDLIETSQAIVRDDVLNSYTKGPFYVLYRQGDKVEKYPVRNIWRVVEDYGVSASRT
jgi:hypothetical protein